MQQRILRVDNHDQGSYVFSGEEFLVLRDTASTASVYVDSYAFCDVYYQIRDGAIYKI